MWTMDENPLNFYYFSIFTPYPFVVFCRDLKLYKISFYLHPIYRLQNLIFM